MAEVKFTKSRLCWVGPSKDRIARMRSMLDAEGIRYRYPATNLPEGLFLSIATQMPHLKPEQIFYLILELEDNDKSIEAFRNNASFLMRSNKLVDQLNNIYKKKS